MRLGRTVAQAVRRWLPTAATRVRLRAEHEGYVVDKTTVEQVFSEYFGFPANHHSANFSIIIITLGWHNRRIGGRSADGPNWTPPPTIPIKKQELNIT
jgi:hypothetical protein